MLVNDPPRMGVALSNMYSLYCGMEAVNEREAEAALLDAEMAEVCGSEDQAAVICRKPPPSTPSPVPPMCPGLTPWRRWPRPAWHRVPPRAPHRDRHLVLLHLDSRTDVQGHLHVGPGLSPGLRRYLTCTGRPAPPGEALAAAAQRLRLPAASYVHPTGEHLDYHWIHFNHGWPRSGRPDESESLASDHQRRQAPSLGWAGRDPVRPDRRRLQRHPSPGDG